MKFEILSVGAVLLMTVLTKAIRSLPAPPTIVSLPVPAMIVSFALPATSEDVPAPP